MSAANPFSRRVDREPTGGASAEDIRSLIAADPAPPPGASFWSNVDAQLAQAEPNTEAVGSDDASVASIDDQRRKRTRRLSAVLAAAAAVVLIGVIATVGQRQSAPTDLAIAQQPNATDAPEDSGTATDQPADDGTDTTDAAQQEANRIANEERRVADARIRAGLTAQELAALDNHGRAGTAIYNVDGGLFFSLSDIAPYGDVTQEAETTRRVQCFLDGLSAELTPEEFAAPTAMDTPVHPAALGLYTACVPAEEIYERFIGSFLWGHREYSQNLPPIDADDPCFAQVFNNAADFVAALDLRQSRGQEAVVACVEARNGGSAGSTDEITAAPPLVLPDAVAGLTPVGYGRVVGLTADRSALYTVDAAPGTNLTCLESPQLQFWLQPLDGSERTAASAHRINAESVTAFASDDTHAVWVEFCEFAESVHVADVAADGSLINPRVLASASGENRRGSVFHLAVDNGVAQAFVRTDELEFDADGSSIDAVERLDIDLDLDSLIAQLPLGPFAAVDLPGATVVYQQGEPLVVLPDGQQRSFASDNFRSTVAYDTTSGVLYASLYADTPGSYIILADGPASATNFAPVGLATSEQLLATVDDGTSWLVTRRADVGCSSTVVVRSAAGTDRTVFESEFAITSLRFDTAGTWHTQGWCPDAAVPTQQYGTAVRNSDGELETFNRYLTTHVIVPEWRYATASRIQDTVTFELLVPADASLQVGARGELVTSGVSSDEFHAPKVSAHPLPVLFSLWDGWQATPTGVDDAALTMQHTSGATVVVHGTDTHRTTIMRGLNIDGVTEQTVAHVQSFRTDTVTSNQMELSADADTSLRHNLANLLVGDTNVFITTSAPIESPEAQTAIDELLTSLRYFDNP